ncbi:MAG: thiamine-phosphate kinase [Chloroflexi bacterium]|nr:thiamine-phosphate kinase [Chloroflexota bacterium]
MKVSDLGELGLISLLAEIVNSTRDDKAPSWKHLQVGIGDDAAAWECDGSTQLATVDALVENVHFTLETTPWYDLGWKALAVNLSDIAAMGGLPKYALVALSLPKDTEVEDVSFLYKGMAALAKQHGIAIIGGDTDSTPCVSVTVTVIGSTGENSRLLRRSEAKAGDRIAVTGELGGAAAGLRMLTGGLKLDSESATYLRNAFVRPVPRVAEGRVMLEKGVRAAIDISDGLVSDLRHICESSRVGAKVNIDLVPVHSAVKANFGKDALGLALSGGEDYELLFTGSADIIDKVRKAVSCPVTVIGEIMPDTSHRVTLIDSKGKPFDIDKSGWEHFKSSKNNQ